MNKKNITKLTIYLLSVLTLVSCDSFLDKEPNKSSSIVPTEVSQLDYLLNNYYNFCNENNSTAFISSDSFGLLSSLEDAEAGTYSMNFLQYATWDKEYLPLEIRNFFFPGEYSKIFIANTVIKYLSTVKGSQKDKTRLEREARFIKAYSLWELAQVYCLPYTKTNENELGLTIKNSTSFEGMQKRSSLKETYNAIESDLKEALNITNDMEIVNGAYKNWRANKAAVNAFAARFYLGLGDYEQALEYANKALESHNILVNYNTDMMYSSIPRFETVNGKKIDLYFPYTYDGNILDQLQWKEFMYYRFVTNESWWFIPSKELLDVYNHEFDLRYKYHIVEDYSFDRGLNDSGVSYPGYVFFSNNNVPEGPTTAEVLLIKAECQARLNNVTDAMATVNKLREARMDASAPSEVLYLSATTKEEAVNKIIEERWREMPFSMRWFDMKRLNHNDVDWDDLGTVTRKFYSYNSSVIIKDNGLKEYTLAPGSRRYAAPINQKEIDASNGVIQQNRY